MGQWKLWIGQLVAGFCGIGAAWMILSHSTHPFWIAVAIPTAIIIYTICVIVGVAIAYGGHKLQPSDLCEDRPLPQKLS